MKHVIAVSLLFVFGGCATHSYYGGQGDLAIMRDRVKSANQQLMDAYNRGDKQAVADMYEDTALMMSSSGERYQGREAIVQYWNPNAKGDAPNNPAISPPTSKWTLNIHSIEGTPPMPIQRGQSILEFQRDGKTTTSDVQFIVIWKRQTDGSYKIAVDAWWPTQK